MSFAERALAFPCADARLVAVISAPVRPSERGVLVVVGGPQYRVGSHRQFTLLCRALAESGIAAMRFDYRGMGDSSGEGRNFEQVGDDLRAAVDAFLGAVPEMHDVVIWGLCDAASAALFYAHSDPRVSGVVLLNPWVRTVEGEAKAVLRHYYLQRLLSPGPWRKLLRGEFDLRGSLRSLAGNFRNATGAGAAAGTLPERMSDALARFDGKVLLILSGNDLTAQEFKGVVLGSTRWRGLLDSPRVTRRELPQANHTFSTREWRDQVALWTADWVRSW